MYCALGAIGKHVQQQKQQCKGRKECRSCGEQAIHESPQNLELLEHLHQMRLIQLFLNLKIHQQLMQLPTPLI